MLIARYLPLATVVGEGDVLELAAREDGGGGEGRSLTLDESLVGRHDCLLGRKWKCEVDGRNQVTRVVTV